MAKVERPKQEECKDHKITVRLTNDEYEKLVKYVQDNETTITQVTQEAINKYINE